MCYKWACQKKEPKDKRKTSGGLINEENLPESNFRQDKADNTDNTENMENLST